MQVFLMECQAPLGHHGLARSGIGRGQGFGRRAGAQHLELEDHEGLSALLHRQGLYDGCESQGIAMLKRLLTGLVAQEMAIQHHPVDGEAQHMEGRLPGL